MLGELPEWQHKMAAGGFSRRRVTRLEQSVVSPMPRSVRVHVELN